MEFLLANGAALLFWGLSLVTVASALMVVLVKNPVHSALFLLMSFSTVAGLFILQGAEFIGMVQLLVYAGGIMVLFLFVIMLVNVEENADLPAFHEQSKVAVVLGMVLLVGMIYALIGATTKTPAEFQSADIAALSSVPQELDKYGFDRAGTAAGNSEAVGLVLYGTYVIPFEVASIFLLVAVVGAIILGKEFLESDRVEE